MKNKKMFVILCVSCCLLCGCTGGTSKNNSFLENVPDPEVFFKESECSKYEVDQLHLKGITVKYVEEDIKETYSNYIKACEETGIWIHPVFDGDTSWCYQNKDRTLQIAINLRENIIDISIKSLNH